MDAQDGFAVCTYVALDHETKGVSIAFRDVEPNVLAAVFDHFSHELRNLPTESRP